MNLEEWYFQTPIVTRCYLTMSFLITAGCALEVRFKVVVFSFSLLFSLFLSVVIIWGHFWHQIYVYLPSLNA
jgi:hypothetical protein|tara:strand:+ start:358 stop:573 length:216 start_codon:yes stop_codon:yes gene_type:complete